MKHLFTIHFALWNKSAPDLERRSRRARMHVQGSQDVVEKDDFSSGIDGPRKSQSRLLTTTEGRKVLAGSGNVSLWSPPQGQATLPNLCLVTRFKQLEVLLQSTLMEYCRNR